METCPGLQLDLWPELRPGLWPMPTRSVRPSGRRAFRPCRAPTEKKGGREKQGREKGGREKQGRGTGRGGRRGDVARLRAAPRCGARTRKGTSCAAPAIRGRARCQMHGGAGSGAPRGNRNAFKDGFYTAAARAERRAMNVFIRDMNAAVDRLERRVRGGGSAADGMTGHSARSGAWGCFAGCSSMRAPGR